MESSTSAQAALDAACRAARNAGAGCRYTTLAVEARRVAPLVCDGSLDAEDAAARLRAAGTESGLSEKEAASAVRYGLVFPAANARRKAERLERANNGPIVKAIRACSGE